MGPDERHGRAAGVERDAPEPPAEVARALLFAGRVEQVGHAEHHEVDPVPREERVVQRVEDSLAAEIPDAERHRVGAVGVIAAVFLGLEQFDFGHHPGDLLVVWLLHGEWLGGRSPSASSC